MICFYCDDGYKNLCIVKLNSIINLKEVNFTLCKLYLHKPDLQKYLLHVFMYHEAICQLKVNAATVPGSPCNPNGNLQDLLQLFISI